MSRKIDSGLTQSTIDLLDTVRRRAVRWINVAKEKQGILNRRGMVVRYFAK